MPARRCVLVVEDDAGIHDALLLILRAEGFAAEGARNGREALGVLERARSPQPFCMVLDLMMPEMDGWELMQRLRERQEWAALPVILVTAALCGSIPTDAPVVGVLQKPFDVTVLLGHVRRCAAPGDVA